MQISYLSQSKLSTSYLWRKKRYRFNTLGFDPKLDEVIQKQKNNEREKDKEPKTQREKNLNNLKNLKKRDDVEREQERDYN